ncbi:hypothetical protein [Pacificoceanicola onchidii]|uniref:hypothetical protein n=1 Tax=Pacificoceanicola onchidii TaxID=2562685 RepID=UPI0010A4C309|nr:hypothetical protein [Pacificoceanicola onchidii]
MSMTDAQTAPQSTATEKTKGFLSGDMGILLVVVLFVALVAVITATFGLPGLAMSGLAMVPVVYAVLLLLTFGK